MGKGSNMTTSSSSSSPDSQALQAYRDLLTRASGVASAPYTPYGGELVAPFNQQQNLGVAGINNYANFAQPYIQDAAGLARAGATPITAADIAQYESPYTQSVIDATQAQFNNQNAQQQQQLLGNAIAQGALGGNRVGIGKAELANQQLLAQAPVIANLRNQGFATGLNTALTEQQAKAAGAYSLGNLGVAGQTAGLGGAGAQFGVGTSQQQTQQAEDIARYQQFLNQLGYPFQTTQWLAGIDTGVGSQMGGTSQGTTTGPAPSMLGQIMGGLTSGVGALGGTGAFGAAGWLTPLMAGLADGGVVGRANGGVAPDPDVPMTIPEGHDTLVAQQKQLVAGHRRAQMFPHGTPELNVPEGMRRVEAHSGAFHYDPKKISPDHIKHLASRGRENELLDLGPVSKAEVLARVERGEHPVAIVERQSDGTEVRAAGGTHLTAHHQAAAMHRTKSPGNTLHIEDVRHTLAHRLHRAWGGRIPHFDTGGGVAGLTPNDMVSGMPYAGGRGWIPTAGITRGPGAPRAAAPGLPGPDQSATKMGEQVGAMAKAITNGGLGWGKSPMNILPEAQGIAAPAPVGGFEPIGTAPEAFSPTDFSGSAGAIFNRGGSVGRYADGGVANLPTTNRIVLPRGYADGGTPYEPPFDPTLGGIAPGPALYNVDPTINHVAKSILSGAEPLPKSRGFDLSPNEPSPLDTAEWPHGPMPSSEWLGANEPSPLDTAEYPHGPRPSSEWLGANEPSPLDTAEWPSGPVGAPGGVLPKGDRSALAARPSFDERFKGAPAPAVVPPPAENSGIANLSPAPIVLPRSAGYPGPAPAVTGIEAIPPAAAANITTPTVGYADNMERIAAAHRQIESRGNYHALGPVHPKTGDRAYGAYQVMGKNIPVWTKEILGKSLTPAQFLASKEAQDAVYKAKMGSYIEQLGLPGAVHAWLGPASKDFTGTTQGQYLRKFEAALGIRGGDDAERRYAGQDDDAAIPPHAKPTEASGVVPAASSGIDWSDKGKLWPALMAAGFGMMASRSPFPGVAIGEGGQHGMQTYQALRHQEAQERMSQSHIDMEAKKLAQTADIAQKNLALHTRVAEGTEKYRTGLLERENSQYLGPTMDGSGSVFLDKRTGSTRVVKDLQVGARPVSGAKSGLAHELMADREKQRAADPSLPPLTLEEATILAQRAPNADQDTIRRLNLASGAWKSWTGNPANMGKKNAPEADLGYWEKRYGVNPTAPPVGHSGRPAAAAPVAAAPAPAPAGAVPARPASVPADAKPQRNKATGAFRWVGADGAVYSADGTRQ